MAESAREYNRQYKQLAREYSSWRGAVQLGYMYDSNAIGEPEQTIPGAILPDAEDHALNGRFRLDYAPRMSGKMTFSSRYDVNALLYDENSISDQILQTIAISPGYRLTNATLTLPLTYTHQIRDGENYQQLFELTPTINLNLDARQVLQLGVGYSYRDTLFDYANATTEALESREGDIYLARLSYFYLFAGNRGMTNVSYEFTDERTDGQHWESQGHRLGLSALVPIGEQLSIDLFAGAYFQDFDAVNFIFNEQRSDATKNFAVGATWDMNASARLYARYQYSRADSNIFIYEHRRNLAMLGVEYGF
jgi:predicted porin